MDGAAGGLGRLRLLRRHRRPAAAGLRARPVPRRPVHPGQHRAGLRLVQRQQVQRRGHRLAAAQAPRRARLPGPARRGPDAAGAALRRRRRRRGAPASPAGPPPPRRSARHDGHSPPELPPPAGRDPPGGPPHDRSDARRPAGARRAHPRHHPAAAALPAGRSAHRRDREAAGCRGPGADAGLQLARDAPPVHRAGARAAQPAPLAVGGPDPAADPRDRVASGWPGCCSSSAADRSGRDG